MVAAESWPREMNAKANYVIDPAASQFTVQVFSGGLLSAFGHSPIISIRDFSGAAQVSLDDPAHSSLQLKIQAASLAVKSDIPHNDRNEIERMMHQDILESSGYPEIVYECLTVTATTSSEGQYSVTLQGNLSMHGVTRRQPVLARVALTGDSLHAFGTFSLRQTDYDLKLVSVGAGAIKVKDELKFSFDIVARKKA